MPDTIPNMSFLEHFGVFLEPFGAKNHRNRLEVRVTATDRAHARKMCFFELLVSELCQGFSSVSFHAMIRAGHWLDRPGGQFVILLPPAGCSKRPAGGN
eukprot:gene24144-biopygen13426